MARLSSSSSSSSSGSSPVVEELLIIDLDWAGVAGKDIYRTAPNPWLGKDRPRPALVRAGVLLKPEHDVLTLRACFGDLWPAELEQLVETEGQPILAAGLHA